MIKEISRFPVLGYFNMTNKFQNLNYKITWYLAYIVIVIVQVLLELSERVLNGILKNTRAVSIAF